MVRVAVIRGPDIILPYPFASGTDLGGKFIDLHKVIVRIVCPGSRCYKQLYRKHVRLYFYSRPFLSCIFLVHDIQFRSKFSVVIQMICLQFFRNGDSKVGILRLYNSIWLQIMFFPQEEIIVICRYIVFGEVLVAGGFDGVLQRKLPVHLGYLQLCSFRKYSLFRCNMHRRAILKGKHTEIHDVLFLFKDSFTLSLRGFFGDCFGLLFRILHTHDSINRKFFCLLYCDSHCPVFADGDSSSRIQICPADKFRIFIIIIGYMKYHGTLACHPDIFECKGHGIFRLDMDVLTDLFLTKVHIIGGNLILIQLLANRLFQRGKNPLSLCRFFGILDIFAEIHAKNAHIRTLRQCSRRDIYVYSRSVCHLYIFIMNGGRHFFCCDISLGLLCRDILPHGFALPVLRLYSNLCLRLRSLCLLFSLFLLDF